MYKVLYIYTYSTNGDSEPRKNCTYVSYIILYMGVVGKLLLSKALDSVFGFFLFGHGWFCSLFFHFSM